MIDRIERSTDSGHRPHGGGRRTRDHDHIEAKPARRLDLAVGGRAATVLGDDDVDAVALQKRALPLHVERPTVEQALHVWEAQWRIDGIDAPYEIEMLRSGFGDMRFLTTDCEKDATRRQAQPGDRLRRRFDVSPAVTSLFGPLRPSKRKRGDAELRGSLLRISGNTRGERVRGIDQEIECMLPEEIGKSFGSAEASDTRGDGLGGRVFRTTGERQQHAMAAIGQGLREVASFSRSAKHQNADAAHA